MKYLTIRCKAFAAANLLLASAASIAEERTLAVTQQPKGRIVIQTSSIRDLTHGYATAWAYTDSSGDKPRRISMAVDHCGEPSGRIVLSASSAELDVYTWTAKGSRPADALARAVCGGRAPSREG
jgi:hypothetical protein